MKIRKVKKVGIIKDIYNYNLRINTGDLIILKEENISNTIFLGRFVLEECQLLFYVESYSFVQNKDELKGFSLFHNCPNVVGPVAWLFNVYKWKIKDNKLILYYFIYNKNGKEAWFKQDLKE